ncbi:hypothetical protein [Actinomadura alba]|uniref:HEAT repeat domain-containing protein n=1 Tax=Actinomadura alba TaxID=406431 RepID=A0ABR7LXV0_9ACTN|nr:hypothetical protein [Actinomadura alba]MBC6469681.1 hypothetical protein [Actinomadura alba]
MPIGWDVLVKTDWSRLSHAYGPAIDTPGHLRRLVGDDEDGWSEAIGHLFGSVTHQSSIYPATAPVALVVAGLLPDPRLARLVPSKWREPEPIRAHLLGFLSAVAEGTEPDRTEDQLWDAYCGPRDADPDDPWSSSSDPESGRMDFQAILDCRTIAPALLQPVLGCLRDDDVVVRVAAADTAAALIQVPTLTSRRAEIIEKLEWIVRVADDYYERAKVLLELGRLGAVDRVFLADPHPGIRLCAATASNMIDDRNATREIMDALIDPDAVPDWYPDFNLLLFNDPWNLLVDHAIRRTEDFDELLPVALSLVARATRESGDSDWGPLLEAAFPEPFSETGSLTDAQRAYLHALIANEDIWRPVPPPKTPLENPWETGKRPDYLFARVGLPYDRDFLRAIAGPPGPW